MCDRSDYNDSGELTMLKLYFEDLRKNPFQMTDFPTLEDADVYKLPILGSLLVRIIQANEAISSVGLSSSRVDCTWEEWPGTSYYHLTDSEYEHCDEFIIKLRSNWLKSERRSALTTGFEFYLYVHQMHNGREDIHDLLEIKVKYLKTTPISLASSRRYSTSIGCFFDMPNMSYFHDLPLKESSSDEFNKVGLTFKTEKFNQAVSDACLVLDRIIQRKKFLKPYVKK